MTTSSANPASSILSDADRRRLSPQTRTYALASFELLRAAAGHLDNGDMRQASETGWGAAAQIVKAVGENWKAQHRALSVTDPDVIKAIEGWKPDYATLGAKGSWQALDARLTALGWNWDDFLANGFMAAANLQRSFEENRFSEFAVKEDLRRTARFVGQMQTWLRQPCPPDGFRQFHNR